MKAAVLKLKAQKMPTPLEREDQEAYFQWLYFVRYEGVRLWDLAYAIPNGSFLAGNSSRRAIQGHALRLQGVKRGVPDVCVAIPVAPYYALYIELKRVGAAKPTDDQIAWQVRLRERGYCAATCFGLVAAQKCTLEYFGLVKQ